MMLRPLTPENHAATLAEAATILQAGGVVVIPTDTVYGVAAHPDHPAAVERLCRVKGRSPAKPIALLVSDVAVVRQRGGYLSAVAGRMADAFWPGALTLVVACGAVTEGFRVPDHDFTRELLRACGGALRVSSANESGGVDARSAAEAWQLLGHEVDLVIDAGAAPGGRASSVVRDMGRNGGWRLLRAGAITEAELERVASLS